MSKQRFELDFLVDRSDIGIIDEIKRVAKLVQAKTLTRKDFDKHSRISSSAVINRFGGWFETLKAAGIEDRYSGRIVSHRMRNQSARTLSNEEIIRELKAAAERLQQTTLAQEDFSRATSLIHPLSIVRRFGTWSRALARAGLKDSPNFRRRFTNEEYFENLLNVWTYLGRRPRYGDIERPPSEISAGAYEGRFGSWRRALAAFVQWANDETLSDPGSHKPEDESEIETVSDSGKTLKNERQSRTRNPSVRLRYKVLVRDGFRCVICGRSPANEPGVKLHLDHVSPYSKDGPTRLENLRTLCLECNLGKGDLIES
ncbi:MAG TPA: HNH endonuclease [Bdellovibrionota bacterium]|nr:HNH endonuclease [Bdellovibrionota bacterium]